METKDMDLTKLKKCTDWFKVTEFRSIRDPSGQFLRKELVVALDQYPYDFGFGPNPREPDPKSKVSKKIGDTLTDNWENFHLLNRGVVVVAKHIDYDNQSTRARLTLDETDDEKNLYGVLDGGNTTKRINLWREELNDEDAAKKLPNTYVNMQVLIPQLKNTSTGEPTPEMITLLNDVKDARNTSVQVKTKSLADARRHFDGLKAVLANEPYFGQIMWHEGQSGIIDALMIVTFLLMFYPTFCDAADGEPSNAYGHKERCLDAFLEYSESEPDQLERWMAILPRMLDLFDELRLTFPNFITRGAFGKINEVRIYDPKRTERGNKKYRSTAPRSEFHGKEMKYYYPAGWIYPIYAAFRFLAVDKSGEVSWRRDPIDFWREHGAAIVKSYVPYWNDVGFDTRRIASNALCYQAVRQSVTDLFKDDVLRRHNIAI
jgi:hypothetical protein